MPRRLVSRLLAVVLALAMIPIVAFSVSATQGPNRFGAADLPTYQTNGIVWALAQANGLVFAGGSFTAVRPAGAAVGSDETPRANFAVFNAATGAPTSCVLHFELPSNPAQATVRSLNVSPDKKTLYVGGFFTAINGARAQHLAAIDIASCSVVNSFRPYPNGTIRAIASSASTVYFGGSLRTMSGLTRNRAAAVSAVGTANPGALLSWRPSFDDDVFAMALKPGGGAVVAGGAFREVNGDETHSLAVLNPTSGSNVKTFPHGFFNLNPDGPVEYSRVKDIAVDATGFYTGNEGRFDGRVAINWSNYGERWRDKCYGATQAVEVYDGILYSGSHIHACLEEPVAMPDGPRQHLAAESVDSPVLLPWMPNTNGGLGEALGPRDVVAAVGPQGDFLWVAGEFTQVNGKPQQGLTRFGHGAQVGPSNVAVSVTSPARGQARVSWRQSLDRDDATLTYKVYRNNSTTPIHTATGTSSFWNRRQMTFTDTGLAPGSTHYYKVSVSDGATTVTSGSRGVTVAAGSSAYAARVLSNNPAFLWRYDDSRDVLISDSTPGNNNGTLLGTFNAAQPGAIRGDRSGGLTINGGLTKIHGETRYTAGANVTIETWLKTTSTTGGRIIGFANTQVRNSYQLDRTLFVTDEGKIAFRGGSNTTTITTSDRYNDGEWHHVVARQGSSSGMALYVDGERQARNSNTSYREIIGYWRIGSDQLVSGTVLPAFTGSLDETAVYARALSATTIEEHYEAGITAAAAPSDTTAPSAPSNVRTSVSGSSVDVAWDASSDEVGVTGYEVHRSTSAGFTPAAATLVGSPTATTFTDRDVAAGTSYYRIIATDAAGNRSAASAAASAKVTTASAGEVIVRPVADTYVNEAVPGANYGRSSSLASRGELGYISYLRFEIPAAPEGKEVSSAVLRVRTTNDSFAGSAEMHTVQLTSGSWSEDGVTWSNRPELADDDVLGAFAPGSQPGTVVDAVLTAAEFDRLTGEEAGLAVTGSDGDSLWFWSSNHATASFRPQLVLTYS